MSRERLVKLGLLEPFEPTTTIPGPVYRIPIRAGAVILVGGLPGDFTVAEAEKVAGVLRAIAFPEESHAQSSHEEKR